MNHATCPACKKPIRVIERHDQKTKRLADHGPAIGLLCKGAGMPVENLKNNVTAPLTPNGNSLRCAT